MKLNIFGVPVEVVSNAEAQAKDYDFAVCARWHGGELILPDNATGFCADCGHAIQFRPNLPKGPPRICVRCAFERAEGGTA